MRERDGARGRERDSEGEGLLSVRHLDLADATYSFCTGHEGAVVHLAQQEVTEIGMTAGYLEAVPKERVALYPCLLKRRAAISVFASTQCLSFAILYQNVRTLPIIVQSPRNILAFVLWIT